VESNYALKVRPSVIAAGCAPVSGAALRSAPGALAATAPTARTSSVARWVAAGEQTISVAHVSIERQHAQISGINGFAAMDLPTTKRVGAPRGVPPRGRPV